MVHHVRDVLAFGEAVRVIGGVLCGLLRLHAHFDEIFFPVLVITPPEFILFSLGSLPQAARSSSSNTPIGLPENAACWLKSKSLRRGNAFKFLRGRTGT